MKISIIIPCYNEKNTIKIIVNKLLKLNNLNIEIIIVDDGSIDGTKEILSKDLQSLVNKIIYHDKNSGKGSAIITGLKSATGDIVIIQDADLEYDPIEIPNLIIPFVEHNADVVYGSRFLGGGKYRRIHFFWHFLANKLLTFFSNILSNLNLSDMETGYKAFKIDVLREISLEQKSFGFEPEVTMKLARKKKIFYEVPVSYSGRSYEEGKKITLKDAFIALYCIVKYRFFK
jgi:glycosyltransferase involved in cell wall biosynthesis